LWDTASSPGTGKHRVNFGKGPAFYRGQNSPRFFSAPEQGGAQGEQGHENGAVRIVKGFKAKIHTILKFRQGFYVPAV
jgi:hypothetical protein